MTLDLLDDLESLLGREQRDQLLRLATEHAERARAAIGQALATGDRARAKAEAHGLRGAVGPFGVPDLADLLQRLESGEAVSADAVAAGIADFVAACEAASGRPT